MNNSYDVVIVGGGMVGASLACALAPRGLRVALVEAVRPGRKEQPSYDERAIALSYGSRRILDTIGAWEHVTEAATPIHKIHISDRGRFGFGHLDAAEEGVPALGYVVAGWQLGNSLYHSLETAAVTQIAPARVVEFTQDQSAVHLQIDQQDSVRQISARLVVAADGSDSQVREQLGIRTRRRTYGQTAIIANISPHRAHRNVAYERFTDSGPLALLPMTNNRCGLVWTCRDEQADALLALNDESFLRRLQERFGYRLGRLRRCGSRRAYPLRQLMANRVVDQRIALAGNAVHTLHPVAGQGFNLGIRDVAVLAETIVDAQQKHDDPGDPRSLDAYARWRRGDHRALAWITDGLARTFANPLAPVAWTRDLGLMATDLVPGMRHRIAHHAMGLSGRLPRLSRGLDLG
ncbi:MAG: 2-octaprenyl-6-methoxyphenyl hydroxylase [Pseudomonadota bacterium]